MPEKKDREKLAEVIKQWNNNRLDLFEISQPDKNLEFHGVMRFFFEDPVDGNVATKCLRVCSKSSTQEVVEILSEKFRPDMKMLTTCYSLYEIHAKKERKLDKNERPLVLQLNWNSNNREGRFVLKKDKQDSQEICHEKEKGGMIQNFKRTLSKKDKKTEKSRTKSTSKVSGDEQKSTGKPPNNTVDPTQHWTENRAQKRQSAPDQPVLPIWIHFTDTSEEAFLTAVINYTNSSTVHFKLSPAYILYTVGRFALEQHRQCSQPSGHKHSVTSITNKMVNMTRTVIQKQQTIAWALTFWLANSSELLNFFKNDKDLSPLTQQSQLDLSCLVHQAYSHLRHCLQNELMKHLPTFLIDPEQHGPLPAGIEKVLNTLMKTMSLLRRCRINPALTIQLFSQLFHFISAWLFNQLVSPEANTPGLCSHYWGAALRQRLTVIEAWAERQGLELAADCHLGHITQATTILTMNKYSIHNAKDIQNTSFKLNSLQLHTLLSSYLYATNEPQIPPDLIAAVVTAAEAAVDNLIRSEGRVVQLEESLDLHLPFLLPEGGYSCDTVRGIPPGFREFLDPICHKGLCSLTCQPNSNGDWTVYFNESTRSAESSHTAQSSEPEIVTFTLNKPLNSGMGVSIVAAKGAGQGNLGIYIKSIVKGGPAEMNGRLTAGDQLLSVDGRSLIGLSQERAAAILMQTGPVVTLQVAKCGASYHGLGPLLSEPTPEEPAGFISNATLNGTKLMLQDVADPGPSDQLHDNSKSRKDQMMQRNRQLYRSNPNMSDTSRVDRDELYAPASRGNCIAAVSSVNLCTDTFHREYMTLPTPKSHDRNVSELNMTHLLDKSNSSRHQQTVMLPLRLLDSQSSNKKTTMRQALSQENLCMDSGGPLLDNRQNTCEQMPWSANTTMRHSSSFPIRSSVSSHDILSNTSSSTKRQQGPRTSGAGIWRTPFSPHPAPTPSTQPIRIDIPVTRAVKTPLNSPLSTFQSSSTVKVGPSLQGNGPSQNPQNPRSVYVRPISGTKLPQLSLSSQQRASTLRSQAIKPQISLSPVKHVSFQEPPTQQKRATSPVKQKEPQEPCDPWRREAREELEKQQRLHVFEILQQEVKELQAKAKRSTEENERLRKLNLEWQFQKRLDELQQRGEDEEEDEEEDLDMMLTVLQLDARAQNKRSSGGNLNWDTNKMEKKETTNLPQTEDTAKRDQTSIGLKSDAQRTAPQEPREEKVKRASAPETLTFKERQRLFSLASSA